MFINSIFGFLVPISAQVSNYEMNAVVTNFNDADFLLQVGRRMADSREIHSRTWRGTNCKSQVYFVYYFLFNCFGRQVPCLTHALAARSFLTDLKQF